MGNRLTLITDPSSNLTTNTYDNNGNLTVTNDNGTVTTNTWTYENRLRTDRTRESFLILGTLINELITVVGSRSTLTRSNGTITTYTYNTRNWLTAMTNKESDNTLISSFTYLHDDLGNRTRMTENNGDYTTYAYDNNYQLTGKYDSNSEFTADDLRHGWDLRGGEKAELLAKVARIREVLTADGRTRAQGALGWLWALSEKTLPIPGFKTVKQVEENAGALEHGPLSQAQMQEIARLLQDYGR